MTLQVHTILNCEFEQFNVIPDSIDCLIKSPFGILPYPFQRRNITSQMSFNFYLELTKGYNNKISRHARVLLYNSTNPEIKYVRDTNSQL